MTAPFFTSGETPCANGVSVLQNHRAAVVLVKHMPKLGKILKVGCLSLMVLAFLAAVGLAVFVWHVQRITPPWPERIPGVRLEPSRPFLAEADVKPDNAYFYIRQLTNWHASLKMPQDEVQQFRAHGYRPNAYLQLEAWLVTNAPALQRVAQAAALTNAQVVTYTPTNMLLSCITEVLNAGKILPFRVQRDAWRQDWLAVSDDFHQTLQLAEHMSRGGVLIHALVGLSVRGIAVYSARELALEPRTPPELDRTLIKLLRELEIQREPFDETMRQECRFSYAYLVHLLREPIPDADMRTFSWTDEDENQLCNYLLRHRLLRGLLGSSTATIAKHAEAVYSHLISVAATPQKALEQDPALAPFLGQSATAPLFRIDDPLGGGLLLSGMQIWLDNFRRQIDHLCLLRGTQVFLALCAFRQEHGGQLPKTLEELVPAYLPQLPADPFAQDGQTFRYRIEQDRWLIWSLGPNRKDDGGRCNWTSPDEYDKPGADVIFASDEFSKARERALAKQVKRKSTAPAGK